MFSFTDLDEMMDDMIHNSYEVEDKIEYELEDEIDIEL